MSTSRHHRLKAFIGIFLGLGIAIGAAVGAYYDWRPDEHSKFGLLVLCALPFGIWGCAHLARARGYPSDIAYVLFFLTTITGTALAFYSSITALLLSFSFVFVLLFPVIIILLVLPKKPHTSHRHGYGNR